MDLTGGTFRYLLAAVVAMWSPLWCCCVHGAGGPAEGVAAAESCHAPAEPPPECSSCEGEGREDGPPAQEGDSDRSCACDQAARPAATPSGEPVMPNVTPVELMPAFALPIHAYVDPMGGTDAVRFASGGAQPPPMDALSLLSLHCQLII